MAKKSTRTQIAFAPVRVVGKTGGPYIAVSCVHGEARGARRDMARLWDDDPAVGWKKAKKAGYRIRKVYVSLAD